jgi:hypothetical protein
MLGKNKFIKDFLERIAQEGAGLIDMNELNTIGSCEIEFELLSRSFFFGQPW